MKALYKKTLHYTRKAITMPPHVVIVKAYRKFNAKIQRKALRKRDLEQPLAPVNVTLVSLLFNARELCFDDLELQHLEHVCDMYSQHRFDLLGSGWIRYDGRGPFLGVEGHVYNHPYTDAVDALPQAHRAECIRLRKLITDSNYTYIDWQRDHKSGFRYRDDQWYLEQPIGVHAGVDIKVPWEIGRLQHLVQMGVQALHMQHNNKEKSQSYAHEYRNQLLDFISANPVRIGAQWTCTMDVGIRAANIALAHTLFKALGDETIIDAHFEQEVASTLYRHCEHIVYNLEWSETLTSNHYLANICGLIFAAMALESTPITNTWLAFGIDQLIKEIDKQFYDDGANFEGSLCYHRLSLEMTLFTVALVCGIAKDRLKAIEQVQKSILPKFPTFHKQEWHSTHAKAQQAQSGVAFFHAGIQEKLARSALLTVHATKDKHCIAQIGDNDSGRFFRISIDGDMLTAQGAEDHYRNLQGYVEAMSSSNASVTSYFDENLLDHRGVIGAAHGLFYSTHFSTGFSAESSIASALSGKKSFTWQEVYDISHVPTCKNVLNTLSAVGDMTLYKDEQQHSRSLLSAGLWHYYPNTGWYIFRSDRVFLFVNAGPNGQNGNSGHCHNDKLSVELQVDGRDIIRDMGTGLYTSAPALRHAYRSTAAHFAPAPSTGEQNRYEPTGLFWMHEDCQCWVQNYDETSITVVLNVKKHGLYVRKVSVFDDEIIISDSSEWQGCAKSIKLPTPMAFSSGYGKIERG